MKIGTEISKYTVKFTYWIEESKKSAQAQGSRDTHNVQVYSHVQI